MDSNGAVPPAFLTCRPLSLNCPPIACRRSQSPGAAAPASTAPPVARAHGAPARVVIVGGGAAGHLAAIACAANCDAHVSILEASPAVLHKVRISGGGRCNVTSAHDAHDTRAFARHYPRGSKEILSVLSRFGPNEARAFFEAQGVQLKVEPTGKVFPTSDDSRTVVRALVEAARKAGVTTTLRARVRDLQIMQGLYHITLAGAQHLEADYVVVATGGARTAHAWARKLGHTVVSTVPSLFTFGVRDKRLHGLEGVSVHDCQVQLNPKPKPTRPIPGLMQRGPVLITHWGLSGPAVLALSAFGARVLHERDYHMLCSIDWLPSMSLDVKLSKLKQARTTLAHKHVLNIHPFRGQLPHRLWRALLRGIPAINPSLKWASVNNNTLNTLVDHLHNCQFHVSSRGQFKEEFVTAGGVALSEISTKTFESKRCPRLFFVGEALDVDGKTGGYNLTFAWASGFIAGLSIAADIDEC